MGLGAEGKYHLNLYSSDYVASKFKFTVAYPEFRRN
jgi:hypothetical protein